jgi:hypothetical protein
MPRAIPVPIRRGPTTPTRAGSLADASVDPTEAKCGTTLIVAPGARDQLEQRRRRLV